MQYFVDLTRTPCKLVLLNDMEYNNANMSIHISASHALSWLQIVSRDHKARLKGTLVCPKVREPGLPRGYGREVGDVVSSKDLQAWLKAT